MVDLTVADVVEHVELVKLIACPAAPSTTQPITAYDHENE
jgi:hypothetical protein